MIETKKCLRTLLVEDCETDAMLIMEALRRGGYLLKSERVDTEESLQRALDEREWDIVFCDYVLPQLDGPTAIRMVRERDRDLPIIVISGAIGEEAAVASLKLGANDYLLKGNLTRLVPAVERELLAAESRCTRRLMEAKKREVEDALRLSEEHYRVLFERNPIPMWVYDRSNWRILQVNEAAIAHYGYSREEFLALSVLDLHVPEDVPVMLSGISDRRNEAPLTRGVWRLRKKNGSLIVAEIVTQPILYRGAHARVAQTVDISERKSAEEALSRIKVAVEFASDAICIMDGFDHVVFLNRAFVDIFGYDAAELNALGGTLTLFINKGIVEQAEAALEATGFWSGETFLRTRLGPVVELFLRVNVVKNAESEPIAYIAVGTDMREMKQAQRTITEQAALLDEAQDAIMVNDLRGKIRYWNQGAERIFGWTKEEAVGRRVHEFLCDAEAQEDAMIAVLQKGSWSGELTKRTKDEREVLMEGRWTLVRDEFGDPKSVLAIETDITEKRTLESQFLRAQRMESIGTLAGGIAHDLNNVLGPIIMAVDLLKLTMSDPKDLELLDTVEVSARRGAEMVKQVLSFARGIEGQRVVLQPARLLKETQKIVRETFPKSITSQVIVPDDVWNLLGDPTQLHQVLLNLCVNARDAMPDGGRLRLSATNFRVDSQFAAMHPEARPGAYVAFEVADNGTGMTPEVAARIFEPFFTTKDIGSGTGLGLSTTLAIARNHDGFIIFESALGKGTRFSVCLPADVEGTGVSMGNMVDELPRGHGECVLVIDDEASIRSITAQSLDAFGYRVLTASDGAEGVAKYAQHMTEIAVVLTDMMMPVMDGPVTIRALMKLNPSVRIIAASGYAAKGAEAEVAAMGVKTFLAKPFTAATLLTTLRDILRPEA
jgi:PAS domain S-box-containing protein